MAATSKREEGQITSTQTLPASTTGTGSDLTLTSGRGDFTLDVAISDSQFKPGAWIYDNTNGKLYKITWVDPDGLYGKIDGTSSDTVTLTDVEYIKASDAKIVKMYLKYVAAGTFNGQSYLVGDSINLESIGVEAKYGSRWVEPAIIGGTNVEYITIKY